MCGKANHYHQVQLQFEVDYIDMQRKKSDCNYKFIIVYQANSHFYAAGFAMNNVYQAYCTPIMDVSLLSS